MPRLPARTLFLAATGLALGLPAAGWCGLRGFVGAHGFDTPDVRPAFTPGAVFSGRFQRDAAAHFDHIFFGRTEMLFLKNGLYELANAGAFHSGFSGHVVQGREGWLFEKPYLDVAFRRGFPIESPAIRRRTRAALQSFRAALPRRADGSAPPFAFVLAPSKAEALRSAAPARYLRFDERPPRASGETPEPYRSFHEILDKEAVPYVDAAALPPPAADPRALFPYGGTHWTVDYAARATAAALALAAPALPRPAPLAPVFEPGPDDPRDRDLAGLLNLPLPYRRRGDVHAHARFPPPPPGAPSDRVVAIVGDSFGEQVREALVRSGLYAPENVVLFFNEKPSAAAFRALAARADVLLFVYSAPSLSKTRVSTALAALANDLAPRVRPSRLYGLGRSPYAAAGDWVEEDGGRTLALAPGAVGRFELPAVGRGGWELVLYPPAEPGAAEAAHFTVEDEDGRVSACRFRPFPDGPAAVVAIPDGAAAHRFSIAAAADAAAPLRLSRFLVRPASSAPSE